MSNEPARKFKIGDKVIWTDNLNKMPKPGVIRGYEEPEPDSDYDLAANGPLYDVQFTPNQTWGEIRAEADLTLSDGTITTPPPDDPFTPYELEMIAREAGGTTIGTWYEGDKLRVTVGAFEHPHKMASLNYVTIRTHRDGKQTDRLNLAARDMITLMGVLRQAAMTCWPPEPQPPVEVTDQDADEDDACPRCGWRPGDPVDQT